MLATLLVAMASIPHPAAAARVDPALEAAIAGGLSTPAAPGASASEGLRFRRDPAIAIRERDAMLARIAAQGGGDSGLSKSVASGRMLKTFDALLRRHGYSPDDLGDVLAAYLVLAWEVVNDADATAQPEGIRAVRRQLGGALAGVPAFARLDDAGRQARAQNTAYMAMVATLNRQAYKAAGEDARLRVLEREVGAQISGTTGIDLRDYRLGPGGLVPR